MTVPVDWRPLLVELTRSYDAWTVFKHLDLTLAGIGDVDSSAPRENWDGVTALAAAWARQAFDGGWMISCEHLPGARLHFFIIPMIMPEVPQLDVFARVTKLGSTFATAQRLCSLSMVDDSGIRRLREGAEAYVLAALYGPRSVGQFRPPAREAQRLQQGIRRDREGFLLAARTLVPTPARRSSTYWAQSLVDGRLRRRETARLQGALILSAPASMRHLLLRIKYRARERCFVSRLGDSGRHLPRSQAEEFVTMARVSHHVVDL